MRFPKNKLLLFVFVLIYLLQTPLTGIGSESQSSNNSERKVIATVGEDGVQRVEVIGGGYYFDPGHIIVKVNTPVELMARDEGSFIPHNIIVNAPEAGIDFNVDLESNPRTIGFTPTKTGTYAMYCDKQLLWFDSHREKGMEGVIEVVE